MKKERLQVGIDVSHKRLDVSIADPTGTLLVQGETFANNRPGYEALRQRLLALQTEAAATGVDVAAESTGYYWLPLFLHWQQDAAWANDELDLYLQNARQVYWFKKGYAAPPLSTQESPRC